MEDERRLADEIEETNRSLGLLEGNEDDEVRDEAAVAQAVKARRQQSFVARNELRRGRTPSMLCSSARLQHLEIRRSQLEIDSEVEALLEGDGALLCETGKRQPQHALGSERATQLRTRLSARPPAPCPPVRSRAGGVRRAEHTPPNAFTY